MNPYIVQHRRDLWRLERQGLWTAARIAQARRDVLSALRKVYGKRLTQRRVERVIYILLTDQSAWFRQKVETQIEERMRRLERQS